LVVNAAKATTVQRLFSLYLDLGCLNTTACAASAEVLRSKQRRFASGRERGGGGGGAFSLGQIHKVLTNPVCRGLTRHRDKTFQGKHPAIVDEATWDRVQATPQAASARKRGVRVALATATPAATGSGAALLGKVRDETGNLLTATHTKLQRARTFPVN
jgi:hypothetical protein